MSKREYTFVERKQVNIMHSAESNKAPIFAISRLRMGTDGPGVTTLVTFMGCPLKCRYCLNPKCHEAIFEEDGATLRKGIQLLTPEELLERVKIDNIYFMATGGGICFGGGEPGLYADFIAEFRDICPSGWKIFIETCIDYSYSTFEKLAPAIDRWYVDIKSMDCDIYENYTGQRCGNLQHLECLKCLVPLEKITVKVPLIPDFNTDEDVSRSIDTIRRIGFTDIRKVEYINRIKDNSHE